MVVQIGEPTERISVLSAMPIAQAVTSITRARTCRANFLIWKSASWRHDEPGP
jgi:hypothetical protein